MTFDVRQLHDREVWEPFILVGHYAHRLVGARCAFGLLSGGDLVGVVLYSQPASYTLCKGVCGPEYRSKVLELARLVICTTADNAASMLIGRSLKLLPDGIVVSYADTNVGHVGYVYQATNWIYTGQGSCEPIWETPDGRLVAKTRRHIDRKARNFGLEWTELVRVKQQGKHRYVTFTGTKRFRREARAALRYGQQAYPKGDTTRHPVEQVTKRFLF